MFRVPGHRKTAASKFIISLAFSDILYSCFHTPIIGIAIYANELYTEENCKPITWIALVCYKTSIYSLVLITIHNYIRLCHDSIYSKVSELMYVYCTKMH